MALGIIGDNIGRPYLKAIKLIFQITFVEVECSTDRVHIGSSCIYP